MQPERGFDHERLKVYDRAVEFFAWCDPVVQRLPPRRLYLADQLGRAASSIAFNVAEGAGEYRNAEKVRFYRIARRSATECAAIIYLMARVGALDRSEHACGRALLLEVVALLTAMCRNREKGTAGQG